MPRFAANLTWILQEVPMLDRFGAARALGFDAVECQFPYEHSPQELARACEDADLQFVMFNAPPGDMDAGEYGLSGLPGRESEFRDSIAMALEYSAVLKNQFIHVLAGIVPKGESREHCHDTYVENLAWAAETCQQAGVGVLIEPINTFEKPGYLTTLTSEAMDTLSRVNHSNLGIQYDFHNAQLMEGCLTRTLEENISAIRHMQIAGVPGRTPPDGGEMNYPYLFELIDRLDYQGWVGCEYRPHGSHDGATKESLGWAREFGIATEA
ncbi:MAG: TIM barrel protein [Rhodospirillaceae bacterium]|jgi:2-dehydrotetronate isomerase|nr:TIM barrel protein [Rhodospirillaceae bacterium]MBT4218663.1 TIM barrel protein [Rhodospirillaceae bacterium]MBT4464639.1 TIM barrel protein [Rhodospirillaceae bacterium]MBT5012915.1 TIM barrel protein [Rhodospirillaceae bacterium]MBT5308663.1 TIM barrel protein [Rhodospirillaceae bacterium]